MDACKPLLLLLFCALMVARTACAQQASKACKHCVERNRQLRVQSAACRRQSGADPLAVARLESGERVEHPAPSLLRYVHCMLERCNVLKRRGGLPEGLLDKLRAEPDAVRAIELRPVDSCARTPHDSAKELAWKLLRRSHNKALLLDSVAYQPGYSSADAEASAHRPPAARQSI